MSQVINIQDTFTCHPTGYSSTNSNYSSVSSSNPISNGYDDSSSTTYAYITCNTGSQAYSYISYTFDVSDIPSNATITSISCSAKVRVSSTSYLTTGTTQLYSGTTAKGSATTTRSTTATSYNLTPGTWTRNELDNIQVRFTVRRGTSSTTRTAYMYFYGATLTVNYSITGTQYILTATSEINGVTVSPITSNKMGGESQEFTIDLGSASLNDITVTDNDIDVTSSLISRTVPSTGSETAIPGSNFTTGLSSNNANFYQSSSTISTSWLEYAIGHSAENPYTSNSSHNTYVKDGGNNTATGWINFPFDFSNIPANATITSMTVRVYGARENATIDSTHVAQFAVYSGNTLKGTAQNFTSTNDSIVTMTDPGTWTRSELDNAYLRFTVAYYGGHLDGATWIVNYEMPGGAQVYYIYTLSNISNDHDIVIANAGAFIPPEEDPQYTYYPITISSINAITEPRSGTTRVVEESNQTITITPTDPLLTLALDNGVDVTNQLQGGIPNNTYTVATASGASYGFSLNANNYYESTNTGVANSAAVARVSFNLETQCTITFQYINYAEGTYDYGIFGNIDSALGTTYTADSNTYLSCATATYNTSVVQTVTYTMNAGQHYIDVKYRKDQYTDENNDSLQFKVEITSLEPAGYTYTLTNINQKHSLIFVFGEVDYYIITSSGTNCKLFPDGQMVKLAGQSYDLIIVPDDPNATVSITDNTTDVTNYLTYEEGVDKNNNIVVNYIYHLANISANHTLVISCVSGSSNEKIYFKTNGTWVQYSKVYIKQNGSWVEQSPSNWSSIFSTTANYVKG